MPKRKPKSKAKQKPSTAIRRKAAKPAAKRAKKVAAKRAKKVAPKPAQKSGYANPQLLVETEWLADHLGDPDLRIVDCNVVMTAKPEGGFDIRNGLPDWRAAHIPNACFIDLMVELAAPHPTLRFMMTPPAQFERVMSAHGIGNRNKVVVYSRGTNSWATRLFLMFRAMGHDKVHVLNGGWDKWVAEGRPTTKVVPSWPRASFTASPRAGQIINKADVVAALGRKDTCMINALHPDVHTGRRFSPSNGRPGHIAGSVNVFANDLVDPVTKTFLPADVLREKFAGVGALKKDRIITYCGGGISATTDSFALLLLGHKNVQLYDGSLTEWGPDKDLPMETGD